MIAEAILKAIIAVLARIWAPAPDPPTLVAFARRFRWTEGIHENEPIEPAKHAAQHRVLRAIGDGVTGRSRYRRFIVIKPTQDGGTWCTVSFVLLYVTTQLHRPVAVGFPDMRLASIAWRNKIHAPIVKATQQAWLPREGPGSEGGSCPVEVALDGTPSYFMGGGSSNEAGQAGLTAFVLIRDERDAMEPYVAELMKGRLDGFDDQAVLVDTSTIKHDKDSAILGDYNGSIALRLAYPCPKCRGYQILDDDQLVYDGSSETAAMQTARLRCRYEDCRHLITDAERVGSEDGSIPGMIADATAVEVGSGQTLHRDGTVTGALPDVLAWGLIWIAHESPIKSLAKLASERWQAEADLRKGDHAKMRRYYRDRCCKVYLGDQVDSTTVSVETLALRSAEAIYAHGLAPSEPCILTGGIDVQLRELWWQIMAHGLDGRWWIAKHGRIVIGKDFRTNPSELEVREALDAVKAIFAEGLPVAGDGDGRRLHPEMQGVDVRYQADIVKAWLAEQDDTWVAVRGAGEGQLSDRPTGERIERIEGYIDIRVGADNRLVYYVEVDPLKHGTTAALARPQNTANAGHLPKGEAADGWLIKQLTAERLVKGKWVKFRRDNHQFDLTNYNRALGRLRIEHGAFASPAASGHAAADLAAALGRLANHQRRF